MSDLLKSRSLNVLIDGQFGSTGKGNIAHFLSRCGDTHVAVAVSNAAPNAGHSFWLGDRKCVAKQLPVTGIVNPTSRIFLAAGAVIDIDGLLDEIERFEIDPNRVYIHPNAAVVTPEHIALERNTKSSATRISSTQSGVGEALIQRIRRHPNTRGIVSEYTDKLERGGIRHIEYFDLNRIVVNLRSGERALMEVPQGIGLSLYGKFYPYCTSRPISVSQALADAEVHPTLLGSVSMTCRTFPIRVGNIRNEDGTEIGWSGPFYPDSEELDWEKLNREPELTTVTKRVRRVASFSRLQYEDSIYSCNPDNVFLTFCDYLDDSNLERLIRKNMARLPNYLVFGPRHSDVVDYWEWRKTGNRHAPQG